MSFSNGMQSGSSGSSNGSGGSVEESGNSSRSSKRGDDQDKEDGSSSEKPPGGNACPSEPFSTPQASPNNPLKSSSILITDIMEVPPGTDEEESTLIEEEEEEEVNRGPFGANSLTLGEGDLFLGGSDTAAMNNYRNSILGANSLEETPLIIDPPPQLPPPSVEQESLLPQRQRKSGKNLVQSTTTTTPLASSEVFHSYGYDGGDEDEDFGKYACSACTFLNWSNSPRCIQCETPRNDSSFYSSYSPSSAPLTIEEMGERLLPLRISDFAKGSGGEEQLVASNNLNLCSQSNLNSKNNMSSESGVGQQGGASELVSMGRTSSTSSSSSSSLKWACSVCTYDNWPRSSKCVMCLTVRPPEDFMSTPPSVPPSSDHQHHRRTPLSVEIESSQEESSLENNCFGGLRKRKERELDVKWLEACRGVVDGRAGPVEEYLGAGGDPARTLTHTEVSILDRPSAFDTGFTLIHLALRFHQESMLASLLSQVDGGPSVVKRVPSYIAPDIAMDIRRIAMASIRQRKGGAFRCNFTCENVIFTLPSEIEDLNPEIQETLFDEILDREVQKELENGHIINWSVECTDQLNSRLYPLWNRSAGDCLLDSVLGATWGIFDRENGLRMALADSLHDCSQMFYQRWKENELLHARLLNFSLNDSQCATDWSKLLSIAGQPGSSLEQLHIFALSHIIRRPIIVYGVKYVKSYSGETLGYARYEGVYLPLLWEPSFCWKSPIVLGYTRGHFTSLVPMESDCDPLMAAFPLSKMENNGDECTTRSTYLPVISADGSLLPIHFLSQSELGKEEVILSQWLELCFTDGGIMVARQRIPKRQHLVSQMIQEWLNRYRDTQLSGSRPYIRPPPTACYSSDESEND